MIHPMANPIELPVAGPAPRERADAVRNRARILDAATQLFAQHGVDCVSMDAIAEAAGVGKGTLFRRFGDRAALVRAMLEEPEIAFQEGFIRGPAPLGPGALPCDRLVAFGHALLDNLECHGDLVLAAEIRAGARFRSPVYGAYRAHVLTLLRDADLDVGADGLEYAADALLAAISAELVLHQRRGRDIPLSALKEGWSQLVCSLLRR
jgi:AcrR family transcriptional regulator